MTKVLLVFDDELRSKKTHHFENGHGFSFHLFMCSFSFVVTVVVIVVTLKCVWERDELAGVGSLTVPPSG